MSDLFAPVQTNDEDLAGLKEKFGNDIDKLAKGKLDADLTIQARERELAELRAQLKSQSTLDEILTQIRTATPVLSEKPAPAPSETQTPDVKSIVAQMIAERDLEARKEANKALVEKALLDKFGADTQLHVNKKAAELGVSLAELQAMALEKPKVFLTLFGTQPQVNPSAPAPRNQFVAPAPTGALDRTAKFYDNLKRTNPSEYFSPKVQNQQMKDAMRLGERYFDL